MTHETEMKVKMEMYARCRANAVATLFGIVGHLWNTSPVGR